MNKRHKIVYGWRLEIRNLYGECISTAYSLDHASLRRYTDHLDGSDFYLCSIKPWSITKDYYSILRDNPTAIVWNHFSITDKE